jgi:hypothetical protein
MHDLKSSVENKTEANKSKYGENEGWLKLVKK